MSNRVNLHWHDLADFPAPKGKTLMFWLEPKPGSRREPHRDERMQTGYVGGAQGSTVYVIGGHFAFDLELVPKKWAYLPDGPNGEAMGDDE